MARTPAKDRVALSAEPWASVDEVAKHLGVAKDSVYRWIEHRSLPAHKIGRLWKFKLTEVDGWVRVGGAGTADDEPGSNGEVGPHDGRTPRRDKGAPRRSRE